LEIVYLLGNWEIVYAYQPDEGAISMSQFGILLPILDQWCNCGREPNIPKWPAILNMNYTVILPLVK
jgi:hypothetical protein